MDSNKFETLAVAEGVKALGQIPVEKRRSEAYALLRDQAGQMLIIKCAGEGIEEVDIFLFKEIFKQLGQWIREVNAAGKFKLPLKAFERALYSELCRMFGYEVEEFESLAGLISTAIEQTSAEVKTVAHVVAVLGIANKIAGGARRSFRLRFATRAAFSFSASAV